MGLFDLAVGVVADGDADARRDAGRVLRAMTRLLRRRLSLTLNATVAMRDDEAAASVLRIIPILRERLRYFAPSSRSRCFLPRISASSVRP